jgi:hypothetical protein
MHEQLWGDESENKLRLRVRERKRLKAIGLKYVGASTSQHPMNLRGLLQGCIETKIKHKRGENGGNVENVEEE